METACGGWLGKFQANAAGEGPLILIWSDNLELNKAVEIEIARQSLADWYRSFGYGHLPSYATVPGSFAELCIHFKAQGCSPLFALQLASCAARIGCALCSSRPRADCNRLHAQVAT